MSVISGVLGSSAQKSAAKTSAASAKETAGMSAETQKYMFDQMMALQQPYNEAGVTALGQLRDVNLTGDARQYQAQVEAMPGLNLPNLNLDPFSYQFDPNDPTYQYRQGEMEKTINQAAAARGNYNSRPVINALSQGNIALTADESEKQFGRALGTYGTNVQTALAQYGADYGKETDIYNTGYGKLTDLYNMSMQTGGADYNKLIDLIKIGQGSAGTAGAGATATGQGLANTYGQLGSSLSQSAIASGQAESDMWGGIGQTNTTVGALALLKYLKYI